MSLVSSRDLIGQSDEKACATMRAYNAKPLPMKCENYEPLYLAQSLHGLVVELALTGERVIRILNPEWLYKTANSLSVSTIRQHAHHSSSCSTRIFHLRGRDRAGIVSWIFTFLFQALLGFI